MKTAIIIPARIGSTRLLRKPLQMIAGMSLIERVYRQCKKATGIDMVVIATDSDEIAKHVNGFKAGAIMTPESCTSGTERVAFAAASLAEDFEIIINVQGDEPLIEPAVIEQCVKAFDDDKVLISTPISPLREKNDRDNPHIVKVVIDKNNDALYFSRSAIPYQNADQTAAMTTWRHAGLYAFRRNALEKIRVLPKTELEETEKLEQLRWLYHGYKIRAFPVEHSSIEVNTGSDVRKVEELLKGTSI